MKAIVTVSWKEDGALSETMVALIDEHLRRLVRSCELLGIGVAVDVAPTEATTTAGLAGQSAGSVVAVGAVGADVVPESSGNPTNTEGGPPAGA